MYSKKEINSDSNYVIASAFIKHCHKKYPKIHFFVPFPNSASGYKYDCDGTFKLPNVTRIAFKMYPGRFMGIYQFDATVWNHIKQKYMIDAFWVNDLEKTGMYKTVYQAPDHEMRPIFVSSHHWMIHKSLRKIYNDKDGKFIPCEMSSISGSYNSDFVFFNSEYTMQMFKESAQQYYKDDVIKSIIDKSKIMPCCVLDEQLVYRQNENDIPVFIYNHRLQSYKKYKDTFTILNQLYKEGLKFKVIVVNTNRENHVQVIQYPFVETRVVKTRQEYIEVLKTGDINCLNSAYETFCIAAVESMALGQILVAPNGITFPFITGKKYNNYPYLFNNKEEQKNILREVIQNKSIRKKWGKILSNYVHDSFNVDNAVDMLLDKIEELYIEFLPKFTSGAVEHFEKNIKEIEGKITFQAFLSKLRAYHPNGTHWFGNQVWPTQKIMKYCRYFGYDIQTRSGKQYLVRKV